MHLIAALIRRLPALAGLLLLCAGPLRAATFVVTSRADTAGSGCGSVCTLRQAITAANATSATDTINFDIDTFPPRGDILIQPLSNLPPVTQPLTINGYSQPGSCLNDSTTVSNATVRIRIDGAAVGSSAPHGLAICASNSSVRGIAVTRFAQHGIIVGDSPCTGAVSNVQLHGNFIGLANSGTASAGNTGTGIRVAASVVDIGSSAAADRNVISANGVFGIELRGTFSGLSDVIGNLIGTDRGGSQDFGNAAAGVRVNDSYNNAFIFRNTIRFNGTGVHINGGVNTRVSQNAIHDNDGLGVDLGTLGVTPNDLNDLDNGPNQLQNFPVINGASRNEDGISASGTLDVGHTSTESYFFELYASPACDASGNGEGERFLGEFQREVSSPNDFFTGNVVTSDPLPTGTVITAIVRSSNAAAGNSEFSACFALDPPPLLVNSADDVDDGVCNATHCSLREAINSANTFNGAGQQFINFAIPPLTGSSEIVIAPATPLPRILRGFLIDGYSQPGSLVNTDPEFSNAIPRIRLAGSASAPVGFDVCASQVLIRGLAFTGFEEGIGFKRAGCDNSSGGTVAGNFFGLRTDGATPGANARHIVFDGTGGSPLTIGGQAIGDRNVFAGGTTGVEMNSASAFSSIRREVLGNLFGSDKSGGLNRAIGTAVSVVDDSVRVFIGSADAPNRFRFNGRAIAVTDGAREVQFGDNLYADSSVLAIDLGADGVTPNDPGDADSGPNGRMNFPLLTLAERNVAGARLVGTVDVPGTPAAGSLTLHFHASATCHPSGNGEGQQLLGSASVGEAFDVILATDADLVALPFITAITTHTDGSSEFSACLQATDPPVGIAVDSNADSLTVDGGCDIVADANPCTLREAILLANSQSGSDRIRFQIPGNGPHLINPVALLPVITGGLTIDGYSEDGATPNAAGEDGFDAVLRIELNAAGLANGLRICTSEAVEVSGIAFFAGTGPMIASRVNDTGNCALNGTLRVRGNQFGIRASGASSAVATAIQAGGGALTAGGPAAADRNLFARATGTAVRIFGATAGGSQVQNNLFGRDGDGLNHPNARDIDLVDASNCTVGGEGALANRFFGSAVAILVTGAGADGNRLHANRFALHTGSTAIDLAAGAGPDGITPNDLNDADSGANEGQNTPVLQAGSATSDSITLTGTLDVPSGIASPVDYRLTFYRSASCNDSAGTGREGEVYLGSLLRGFSSSAESFSVTLAVAPEAGFITATATSPAGSTSEFGNCLAAPRPDNLHADGFE
ncbi:MAG: CSLREA domain-containing protein [Xanthomonadales bacterium PRO6]|nr:hypothetical protein [Xanthomonadales bacterium]MCE7932093.1 CSLREA domain-containing protein [Xanthomonadales bacterium PRO6]